MVLIAIVLSPLAQANDARPPKSSRILKIYETPAEVATRDERTVHQLNLAGYQRPDMIGYIYSGEFVLVPATGLDNVSYYSQTFADMAARCPGLNLDAAQYDILPYLFSNAKDLFDRFRSGRLSQSEVFQAAWMGMLGLSKHWSCQWDPTGLTTLDQAQAQCDRAARDLESVGLFPSLDAQHDVQQFLSQHGCDSAEARHLARQLIAFGREEQVRTYFTPTMPSPDSPEGKAYSSTLANCLRSAADDTEYRWCGCYVQTLHSLNPPQSVLTALADNPFVDGATYITWLVRHVSGANALYSCADKIPGYGKWRESRFPRPTACLAGEEPSDNGGRQCHYRAAWGEFSLTAEQCAPEISSRQWGTREVDCSVGGAIARPSREPRRWQDGAYTKIDYEHEMPSDFSPPLPDDARAIVPLTIRLLYRKTPGTLKWVSLTPLTLATFAYMDMPFELQTSNTLGRDIGAIDREGALLLE
ncbi:MAG: hypothetical protein WCH04_17105, partial [Gammaproteobacteria bacterium]